MLDLILSVTCVDRSVYYFFNSLSYYLNGSSCFIGVAMFSTFLFSAKSLVDGIKLLSFSVVVTEQLHLELNNYNFTHTIGECQFNPLSETCSF